MFHRKIGFIAFLTVLAVWGSSHGAPKKKASKKVDLPPHNNSWAVGLTGGYYSLDGISSNLHTELTYDYFLPSHSFFLEAVAGIGPNVTESKSRQPTAFDNKFLVTYGIQGVYVVGQPKILNLTRPIHFLTLGFTGVYIGSETAIGVTAGFGGRLPLKKGKNSGFSLRYEAKDQIYTQRNALEAPITQNIYLGLGLQYHTTKL